MMWCSLISTPLFPSQQPKEREIERPVGNHRRNLGVQEKSWRESNFLTQWQHSAEQWYSPNTHLSLLGLRFEIIIKKACKHFGTKGAVQTKLAFLFVSLQGWLWWWIFLTKLTLYFSCKTYRPILTHQQICALPMNAWCTFQATFMVYQNELYCMFPKQRRDKQLSSTELARGSRVHHFLPPEQRWIKPGSFSKKRGPNSDTDLWVSDKIGRALRLGLQQQVEKHNFN